MRANRNCVDAHLDNWIIVAARLGHIAKVENFGFFDFELFEEMSHTEDFVHTRDESVDTGSAADFVFVIWCKLFDASDDGFALLAIRIPSIFGFGASFLAKGREGDLAEAVFDNLVAFGKFVSFPVAKLGSGFFDSVGDFFDLLVSEREVVDLLPFVFGGVEAIILRALCDKEMKMLELRRGGADVFEAVDNLDEELLELLAADWGDFVFAKKVAEKLGDFVRNRSLSNV